MQFFQWTTDYQLYRKQFPKRDSYEDFLPRRQQEQVSAGIPIHRLMAEHIWLHQDGGPYYNVHPKLVSRLCKVDMSKIPSVLLKMPHGLRAVNIRFAEQHHEFTLREEQHTDLTAKISNTKGIAPAGSFVHSILMVKIHQMVMLILDFDVYTPLGQPVYTMFGIPCQEGMSLEESINKTKVQGRSPSYIDVTENLMRLCVSIGFLADNPTLCEPDVLAKDRQEFQSANDSRREFLAQRAKRKGKHGYNIGTDIMFLGEHPVSDRKQSGHTGRELEYAHIRSGHPHLVRHGEGKKLVKLMWYIPTHVRPDKPFRT